MSPSNRKCAIVSLEWALSMNDYYPFLVEKVSRLERSHESRRKAYDSARDELVARLARPALRVPETEIAAERRAFDAAIEEIEAELARDGSLAAAALDPAVGTSSDSPASAQMTRSEPEFVPTLLGPAGPQARAPTIAGGVELPAQSHQRADKSEPERELLQANPADRALRADDLRAVSWDAVHDFELMRERRAPVAAAPKAGRRRLKGIIIAIGACCLVGAAIYFSASIEKWLGI
jgi:hypothetical protein